MKMYNPPHPGEIIKGLWLDPIGISITQTAAAMGISRKTLSKIVNGNGRITPETAVRLSVTLGSSPESWLGHQAAYDLWQVEQYRTKLNAVSLLPSATLATS
ncbi:Antitoxin HigA [hydrothermal vent metagenome]|uniref:Antitoxin HigA n=1 Tax=hydrothermal vent metagenome TaxID=652676 RepID=A0A3B0UWW7_9ZZZZ